MRRLGIICAMEREMSIISGRPDVAGVRCVLSGIGKVNAAVATIGIIGDFKPDAVLSLGVAGSFAEGIGVGDIVIATQTAYHDIWCGEGNVFGQVQGLPPRFDSDPALLAAARGLLPDAKTGLICSGDQFYIGEQEDLRQKRLYPEALAVDMESAAAAQVCHLNGIPFLSVRAISDIHGDGLQREHYKSFWQSSSEDILTRLGDFAVALAASL